MNTTKEGIEVKAGQVWEDLDKRMNGRRKTVIAVDGGKAHMDGYPKTKVSICRMHKNSTGWKLVHNVEVRGAARGGLAEEKPLDRRPSRLTG